MAVGCAIDELAVVNSQRQVVDAGFEIGPIGVRMVAVGVVEVEVRPFCHGAFEGVYDGGDAGFFSFSHSGRTFLHEGDTNGGIFGCPPPGILMDDVTGGAFLPDPVCDPAGIDP